MDKKGKLSKGKLSENFSLNFQIAKLEASVNVRILKSALFTFSWASSHQLS